MSLPEFYSFDLMRAVSMNQNMKLLRFIDASGPSHISHSNFTEKSHKNKNSFKIGQIKDSARFLLLFPAEVPVYRLLA